MPKIKQHILPIIFVVIFTSVCAAEENIQGEAVYIQGEHHFIPKEGFVPNEETAIRIAEAVWLPIYGKSIYEERPFKAELANGVWYVTGSLPEGWLGGVAEAEINKVDGKILRVSHGE